jgi:hypothetical protein
VSYPAKTILPYECYLLLLGVLFLLVPNTLLGLFQIPPTSEVWIRVVGMLLIGLGIYYLVALRSELRPFIVWSVSLRASVILVFGAFVITGLAPPVLLVFSAIDLIGALWTRSALRREASGHESHTA